MAEFLSNYGLWILLGGIFVAMHTQRRGVWGTPSPRRFVRGEGPRACK